MATVTGMTAAAMEAIRDGTIVNGAFDSAGHLILTKYDGSQIDGGAVLNATTGQSGVAELATSAETQAGTDTTRVVTPAGLASIPGYKVQILATNAVAESALPTAYPNGTSLMSVGTSSGWSINGGFGTVVTEFADISRTVQIFYENSGGTSSTKAWVREYNNSVGGGGWTTWAQMMLMVQLTAANFTQATTRGNYPSGISRLYYTTTTSTSWDFSGLAGEVETYIDGPDFGRQTFTQHLGGSANPVRWFRTATAAGGWTPWQKLLVDPGAWTAYSPVWTGATTNPVIGNGTLQGRYVKLGRTVHLNITLVPGNTTTYGSGNYSLSLPFQAANSGATYVGSAQLTGVDRWQGQVIVTPNTSTLSAFFPNSATDTRINFHTSTRPEAMSTGPLLRIGLTYEAIS